MPRTVVAPLLAALLLTPVPRSLEGQVHGYTVGEWSRVTTEHFEFLYPRELSDWSLHMARRMEAVHGAVEAMVGFAPEDRVTVLVDDPGNVSNGSMNPGPLLYMWPTPPNPRSMIGENRGWGEILAVHEFAHAAHLTRPSRNPAREFLTSLLPIPVTGIMWKTPRWATEGYATYVEGRLTGSGRPHGVWRPAVLRTWALEGQLPTYGRVSAASGYWGGAMAYLVGSAYLEWLVEREGGREEALPDLWARLTARQQRSFAGAFTGVFGAPPEELYGRFTVEVTERALAVEDAVEAAGGAVEGELFQRLTWGTGDPAVSPDGERVALVLRSEDAPSRLVVISTTPDTLTTKERERREGVFEEDPEDVPPVERRPRRQEPLATLRSVLGAAYDAPAWLPDGSGILVTRSDVVANGQTRPDLFIWSWEDGDVRRITRGQAIREAAPAPDGTWAAGVRCLHARCDIVRIDLRDGAVTTLAPAGLLSPYYHPRVSPDGRTIVASVQTDGEWRLVAMNADGSNRRFIGPEDDAARFDAEFLGDGRLLVTSTRGGIHDIEILDPAGGEARALTRVVGAAVAPTAGREGDVFFLSLHSRGWDLRRVPRESVASPEVSTSVEQFPAATIPLGPGVEFDEAAVGPVRPYGLGPRSRTILPMVHLAEDGYGGGVTLAGTDPIGRLSWQAQLAYGTDEAPAGGSFRLRYRGIRPWLHVEGFGIRDPFGIRDGTGGAPPTVLPGGGAPPAMLEHDERFFGAFSALELRRTRLASDHALRVGGTAARLDGTGVDRLAAFGDYRLSLAQGRGALRVEESVRLHGAVGATGALDWNRWLVEGELSVRGLTRGIAVSGLLGETDAPEGSLEAFSVGGAPPLLFDPAVLSQRIAMPALRRGNLRGESVRTVRGELQGFFPADPFFWAARTDPDGGDWYRLVGLQLDEVTPPIPHIRLPSIRIRSGVARLLDAPDEGEWRAWLTLWFTP